MLLCHNLEPHQSQSNLPIVTLILIVTVHNLSALSGFLSIYLPVEILVSSLADTVTCDHRSLRHICRRLSSLSLCPPGQYDVMCLELCLLLYLYLLAMIVIVRTD